MCMLSLKRLTSTYAECHHTDENRSRHNPGTYQFSLIDCSLMLTIMRVIDSSTRLPFQLAFSQFSIPHEWG